MDIPSIKGQIKDLILNSLNLPYESKSCQDNIVAGNHYQSVALGAMETRGFRTPRTEFLDRIDFRGKKVLDLGSNLGEMSRAVRDRGADLVDGFEYDPFFLELASLINVYNHTTRVSFYQRDITDPVTYGERYDIVLAFSVFTFVRRVLDIIAAITDQLFVVETHKLEDNLDSSYLKPVLRYFPHFVILGESDWSSRNTSGERRAVVVFAKDASVLETLVDPASATTGPSQTAIGSTTEPVLPMRDGFVDVGRTCLQKRFFEKFGQRSTEQLLSKIKALAIDLDAAAETHDLESRLYSGWTYWALFTKGCLQYAAANQVDEDNVYYQYMTKYYGPRNHDPGLAAVLANPGSAAERVTRRFQDFDLFRRLNGRADLPAELVPIHVYVNDSSERQGLPVYFCESDTPVMADAVDGWHRLFSAKLWQIRKLPCQIVRQSVIASA